MNVGIFVPNVGNFGAKGYYNSQEIGLGKELSKKQCRVTIFKLVTNIKTIKTEVINERCKIKYIPARKIGINGIISDFSAIDSEKIDKIVCFSDIQIIVRRLYRYCIKNNIEFIPYIGVIESSSNNIIIKNLMKIFKKQNISIYKKCNKIMAKTPSIIKELENNDVYGSLLSPVGLDFDIMHQEFEKESSILLRKELGYSKKDKIVLFIGRLEEQKNPLLAIEILSNILLKDKSFKMIMIGSGNLKNKVLEKINDGLIERINFIEKINNDEIWKYYRISDCFINLNKDEIFGMAILEAMYYKCPVIAVKAPGPNYIISNRDVGVLVDNIDKEKITEIILDENKKLEYVKEKSNKYIKYHFSWSICAENVLM